MGNNSARQVQLDRTFSKKSLTRDASKVKCFDPKQVQKFLNIIPIMVEITTASDDLFVDMESTHVRITEKIYSTYTSFETLLTTFSDLVDLLDSECLLINDETSHVHQEC